MPERWRRCSACKQDIALGAIHWVCSVSTCNRKRTGLVFCSVDCWEVHLPTERHREAWAVEARAPDRPEPPPAPKPDRPARKPAGGDAPARPGSASGSPSSPAAGSARPTHLVRRAKDARGERPAPSSSAGQSTGQSPAARADDASDEILVVASRLKDYVRAQSGFNTSTGVLPVLSRALRRICDEAVENAREAERLTVMARDVPRD